jgi:hypothetical protein
LEKGPGKRSDQDVNKSERRGQKTEHQVGKTKPDPKKRKEREKQLTVQIIEDIRKEQKKGKGGTIFRFRKGGRRFRQRRILLSWSETGTGFESGK